MRLKYQVLVIEKAHLSVSTEYEPVEDQRLRREAEFHDRVFDEGHRRAASKYYSVLEPLKAEKLRRVATRAAGARILEYGCGPTGITSRWWAAAKSVDLIDISPVSIDLVREEAAGVRNVTATVMNAEELTFEDHSFDLVVGDGILHHLDLAAAVAEIRRVLSPEGTALFIEPLAANPIVAAYRVLTPRQRTVDEHPLRRSDLRFISEKFPGTEVKPGGLTSLSAIALPERYGHAKAVSRLTDLDRLLFHVPPLSRLAWACLLDLSA